MKDVSYVQCSLVKGNTHTTSWIPSKFAKKGKILELKKSDGTWENGWVVTDLGGRQDGKALEAYRKATLPSIQE